MNDLDLVLPDGQKGRARAYAEGVLLCVCERAFAPGQPFVATVHKAGDTLELSGKSGGSKLRDDGAFDVRVRLHSLRREHRIWLEQNLAARS